jgi:hypothetical protein
MTDTDGAENGVQAMQMVTLRLLNGGDPPPDRYLSNLFHEHAEVQHVRVRNGENETSLAVFVIAESEAGALLQVREICLRIISSNPVLAHCRLVE